MFIDLFSAFLYENKTFYRRELIYSTTFQNIKGDAFCELYTQAAYQ